MPRELPKLTAYRRELMLRLPLGTGQLPGIGARKQLNQLCRWGWVRLHAGAYSITPTGEAALQQPPPLPRNYVDAETQELVCTNCQVRFRLALPMETKLALKLARLWEKLHKHCRAAPPLTPGA